MEDERGAFLPREMLARLALDRLLKGESVPFEKLVRLPREAFNQAWYHTPYDLDLAKLLEKRPSVQEFEDAFYPHRPALRKAGLDSVHDVGDGRWTPTSTHFAPEHQLLLWTFRNPHVAPALEPKELVSQGWSKEDAADRIYPVRRMLLTNGRPDVEAQARYWAEMATKIAEVEEARKATLKRQEEAQATVLLALGLESSLDSEPLSVGLAPSMDPVDGARLPAADPAEDAAAVTSTEVVDAAPAAFVGASHRDAEIAKMSAAGRTEAHIATRFQISNKRARNIVWELRRKYGPDRVPYHRSRVLPDSGAASG